MVRNMSVYQQFFGSASAIPNQTNTSATSFFPALGGGGGGGGGPVVASQVITSSIVGSGAPSTMVNIGATDSINLFAPLTTINSFNGTGGVLTVSSINCSTINGAAPGGGGGGGGNQSTISQFYASSISDNGTSGFLSIAPKTGLYIQSPTSVSSLTVQNINGVPYQPYTAVGANPEFSSCTISTTGLFQTGIVIGYPADLRCVGDALLLQGSTITANWVNGSNTQFNVKGDLAVSSINGQPVATNSTAVVSSIGVVGGASTIYVAQTSGSGSLPPVQFTDAFTLNANRHYQLSANFNYQIVGDLLNSTENMFFRVTNAPCGTYYTQTTAYTGKSNVTPVTCVWDFCTDTTAVTNAQIDLGLQGSGESLSFSSIITPLTSQGFSLLLTDLGARP